jgi:nucleoside-triphosphatase THEP1
MDPLARSPEADVFGLKTGNDLRQEVRRTAHRVILVSGPRHSGKTSLVEALLASLRGKRLRIAGILAKGLWQDKLRSGFDLVNLADGSRTPLARRRREPHPRHGMMFDFFEAGLQAGRGALDPGRCRGADLVVVDELGRLEAGGGGWTPSVKVLLARTAPVFILIVQLDSLERIIHLLGICDPVVIDVRETDALGQLEAALAVKMASSAA